MTNFNNWDSETRQCLILIRFPMTSKSK